MTLPARILVTGANGDIATAIGRILRDAIPGVMLAGCDMQGEWPGRGVFDAMHPLPRADDASYTERLMDLAAQTGAELVIPTSEAELGRLAVEDDARNALPLLMNDPGLVRICLDKVATAEWLAGIGLDAPRCHDLEDASASDLPLMVKPKRGSGSRGLEIVRDELHLRSCKARRADDAFAQELLEPHSGEFTCALFRSGDHFRALAMRRVLLGGVTSRFEVADIASVNQALARLAKSLPDIAAVNVQLRLIKRGPVIFEINPRLSSTVMMRRRIGFDDLMWWIAARGGAAPSPFTAPTGTRVYRTYDELVVPAEAVAQGALL